MKKIFLLTAIMLFSFISCKQEKLHVQIEDLLNSPEKWEIKRFGKYEDIYILIKNQNLYDLKNTIMVHDINGRFMPYWYEESQYAKKEFTKKEEGVIAEVAENKLSKIKVIKTFIRPKKSYQNETRDQDGITGRVRSKEEDLWLKFGLKNTLE